MPFHAYLLRCADGSYYVGHTDDLERRIGAHRSGLIPGYTATRLPVALLWQESFPSRDEALAAERQIKGWSRAKKEALVAGDFALIQALARRKVLRDEASAGSASPQDEREGRMTVPPPAIVLVRPQLAENIGAAARAMLNFGLTDLRLVAPRDGWPNPAAGPPASGADDVLAGARVFDGVGEAVADCAHVYATTVRKRGVTKPVVGPDVAAEAMRAGPGASAVLFGPERSGLETEDVAVARAILTVPINPDFGSLNLAQAVILVAYEWSRGASLAQPPATDLDPPAPQAELDGMIAQWDAMLEEAGYFFPPDRVATTRRTLRTLLTRPGWTSQEVRTIRGMLSTLDRPRPR